MTTTQKYIANDRPATETNYNGWTNYQTWVTKLWMDNDQESYNYWQGRAAAMFKAADGAGDRSFRARVDLADDLKAQHEDAMPEITGVFSDLMSSALGLVDWFEIADNLLDEVVNAS
jgi:hypothetical protein